MFDEKQEDFQKEGHNRPGIAHGWGTLDGKKQNSREKTEDTIWKHMTAKVDKVECDKAGAESKSEKEIIDGRIKSTDIEQYLLSKT